MGALFNASMRLCDDCGRERTDLDWYGRLIRICGECRATRVAATTEQRRKANRAPIPSSNEQET